jgi:hypothetical protein
VCLDEVEVFDTEGRNVALATNGGKASASGTLPGHAIHQLTHINDGKFGNAHSWISNTKGSGWVQIDFPAKVWRLTPLSRFVEQGTTCFYSSLVSFPFVRNHKRGGRRRG